MTAEFEKKVPYEAELCKVNFYLLFLGSFQSEPPTNHFLNSFYFDLFRRLYQRAYHCSNLRGR